MTPNDTINNAIALRGMMPMDGRCVCASCRRSDFDRDEMAAASQFQRGHVAALEEYFGGKVCDTCANDITLDEPADDDREGVYVNGVAL